MTSAKELYEEEITALISKEHYFNFPDDVKSKIKILGSNPKHDLYSTDEKYKEMAIEISKLKKAHLKYRDKILNK